MLTVEAGAAADCTARTEGRWSSARGWSAGLSR